MGKAKREQIGAGEPMDLEAIAKAKRAAHREAQKETRAKFEEQKAALKEGEKMLKAEQKKLNQRIAQSKSRKSGASSSSADPDL